jgi:hypothetical protein
MKKLRVHFILFAITLSMLAFSCEKQEGIGGTSTITGRVIIKQYNDNFTTLMEQYPATDEEVFVVYGDDPVYGDKTTTHYDGTFRFEYLREGNYTVFAYSEDSAYYPTRHEIPVKKEVRISDKNQVVTVGDIIILK